MKGNSQSVLMSVETLPYMLETITVKLNNLILGTGTTRSYWLNVNHKATAKLITN